VVVLQRTNSVTSAARSKNLRFMIVRPFLEISAAGDSVLPGALPPINKKEAGTGFAMEENFLR